jgi:hypothetical protein
MGWPNKPVGNQIEEFAVGKQALRQNLSSIRSAAAGLPRGVRFAC